MKIGIDTFGCDHARSGLGSYLLSFTANLIQDKDTQIELFGAEIDKFTYTSGKDIAYKSVEIPDSLNAERLWHFTRLNKFASIQKYDAMIFPAVERVFPVSFKIPSVAVVNSVLFSQLDGTNDWLQKYQVKKGLKKIDKIIAASKYIRDDLIFNGIDEDKIEIVHNGIDHKCFYPILENDSEVVDLKPFAIKRPYFIYGSRLSGPEKKHIELIKAFTLFKERTKLPHRLVLAGSDGAFAGEIHKVAFESSVASDIFLTGYFPHESFPMLYSASDACIFPSVNEGVGLPVLEAMATGVPVLCSNKGALPEVTENSAYLFDSDNIEEISFAMEKVVTDNELRSNLIKKSLQRAQDFNWETTVKNTLDIVKKLV